MPGVDFSEIKQLTIASSTFRNLANNYSDGGGALKISETAINKKQSNFILISNCLFESNSGLYGGGLALLDTANVTINKGTRFVGNQAFKSGGGLYFYCNNHKEDKIKCSLTLNDV